MKKKIVSFAVVLCMTAAMAVPAFAANTVPNVNNGIDPVTMEGHKGTGYTDGSGNNEQTAGASYQEATIGSNDSGSTWYSEDGDGGDTATNSAEIYIWAKVTSAGDKIYKIDIAWGAMKFEFSGGEQTWNVETHQYDAGSGQKEWLEESADQSVGYLDDVNNKIEITNHSNSGITAKFSYGMEDDGTGKTAFNASATSVDAVVGNFFADNDAAKIGAGMLTGTHDGAGVTQAVTGTLTNNIYSSATQTAVPTPNAIALPTAEENYGGTSEAAGGRTETINFAFSGTPDTGELRGKPLNEFQKVGVITVTVTPNTDPDLNASGASLTEEQQVAAFILAVTTANSSDTIDTVAELTGIPGFNALDSAYATLTGNDNLTTTLGSSDSDAETAATTIMNSTETTWAGLATEIQNAI